MCWSKEGSDLHFKCGKCGELVSKMPQYTIEGIVSGNYAYECKNCNLVYDVWCKENQMKFRIIGITLIMLLIIVLTVY